MKAQSKFILNQSPPLSLSTSLSGRRIFIVAFFVALLLEVQKRQGGGEQLTRIIPHPDATGLLEPETSITSSVQALSESS